jgi:hypothetical protein
VSQSRSQRDDQYFDDPDGPENSKKSLGSKLFSISIIGVVIVLSSTFASNINLNNAAPIEFGQGVAVATACDSTLTLTPVSTFKNSNSGEFFAFSGIKISGIDGTAKTNSSDEGCAGKYFTIKAYGSTGNNPLLSSIISLNNSGVFSSGDGRTVASNESSNNSSVTLTLDEPSLAATSVYKLTLESSLGVINLTSLSNFPGSIYIASIDNSRNDVTYAIAGPLDINGNFTQCKIYRSNNLGITWTEVSTLPICFWYMTVSNDGT